MSGEFWNMGGYAFYVWASYGAGLAVFLWNAWSARAQRDGFERRARLESGGESNK